MEQPENCGHSCPITQYHLTDPSLLNALVKVGRIEHVKLDSRRMNFELALADCNQLHFEMAHCKSLMRARGTVDSDNALLAVIFSGGRGTQFNGHEVVPHTLLFYGSGAEIEGAGGDGFKYLGLSIPWSKIESYLLHCEHREAGILKQSCSSILSPGVCDLAGALWDSLKDSRGSDCSWTEQVLQTFFDRGDLAVCDTTTFSKRRKVVLTVEEYMRENIGSCISTETLCRISGVSRRSLEYYFHDILGSSPKAYLRQLRLHKARNLLCSSENEWGLVRRVAKRCGFRHLGEFSRDYQRLFGECPIDTLKNPKLLRKGKDKIIFMQEKTR